MQYTYKECSPENHLSKFSPMFSVIGPGVIFIFCALLLNFLVSISLPFLPTLDITRVYFDGPNEYIGGPNISQGWAELRVSLIRLLTIINLVDFLSSLVHGKGSIVIIVTWIILDCIGHHATTTHLMIVYARHPVRIDPSENCDVTSRFDASSYFILIKCMRTASQP